MYNLSKKKSLIFLFHSLTPSLYFSLSLRIAPPEALTCVFLTMAEWLSLASALHRVFLFVTPSGRMAFFSFFSFSLACTTHLGSLLIKRSQTSYKSRPFLNKWESWIWGLLEQAHKSALTKCVCWNPKGVTCTQHK